MLWADIVQADYRLRLSSGQGQMLSLEGMQTESGR